jgi:hypothetical protein
MTAVEFRCVPASGDHGAPPPRCVPLSHPTPAFRNVSISIDSTSLRLSPDHLQILADVTVVGELKDRAGELAGPSQGIRFVTVQVGESQERRVSLEPQRGESSGCLSQGSASFRTTLEGLVVCPGTNTVTLTATNAFRFSGYARVALEVRVIAPAGIDEEAVADYTHCSFDVGRAGVPEYSGDGPFEPFLIEVVGPAKTVREVKAVAIDSRSYSIVEQSGRRYLAADQDVLPKAFLAVLIGAEERSQALPFRSSSSSFSEGFGAGFSDVGLGIYDGHDLLAPVVWHSLEDPDPPVATVRLGGEKDSELDLRLDMAVFSPELDTLARIAENLVENDEQVFTDVLFGHQREVNAVGVCRSSKASTIFKIRCSPRRKRPARTHAKATQVCESDSKPGGWMQQSC